MHRQAGLGTGHRQAADDVADTAQGALFRTYVALSTAVALAVTRKRTKAEHFAFPDAAKHVA
jgi:hypothetical protein